MLEESFLRLKGLIGESCFKKLKDTKILVFGVGGVGGQLVNALARSCFGRIDLVDGDVFCFSNINRQLGATTKTVGKKKVYVLKEMIEEINPSCFVKVFNFFYGQDTKKLIDFSKYSYVVDAVDSVEAKLLIVKTAKEQNIRVISSMGAGNKLDPTIVEIEDIFKTSYCPLARIFRKKLRENNIESLKVCYSKEKPKKHVERFIPSCAFVPASFGLALAYEIFKDLVLE